MGIRQWREKVAKAHKNAIEEFETKRLNSMPKHLRAKELKKKEQAKKSS